MSYRLDLQVDVLRLLGIFPPANGSNATAMIAFNIYRVMFFAVVGIVTLSMTVQIFAAPDLSVLARTVDMWTMSFTGLYKWACMTWCSDRYAEFQSALLTIGDQGTKAYCQSSRLFVAKRMKSTRCVTVVYLITGIALSAFLIVSPLITYSKGDRSDFAYFNDPKSYPLSCWMPFTINNYTLFYSMFTLKSAVLFIAVNLYLSIDTFVFGAIYAIGGQIELLNASLNNVFNDLTIDDSGSITRFGSEKNKMWHSRLCECIKFHTMILDYISKLEAMFRSLLLADYLHAIASVTFAMFQTTVSNSRTEV
ncbi:uncharacterized protein LOC126843064 [Adelges cooleyi]|uniref:uncharacterized protein LOC126843064 n=1 Tax=Adelges cooleyi TaxID=133065 RepID=UPI0021805855|nr:uncharacterized protein LOC126843064 [Adelges cooleyi]